ncbi:hypothetical protein C8Q77DRAFT_220417 [Trametes polyzona]|nr:hypothetical protein C8Q77DRAFT_220417 [Trametes polyzona]
MPRFINTISGAFEWHDDPRKVVYAILSHTWRLRSEGGEQSYTDVEELRSAINEEARSQQRKLYALAVREFQDSPHAQPSEVPRASCLLPKPTLNSPPQSPSDNILPDTRRFSHSNAEGVLAGLAGLHTREPIVVEDQLRQRHLYAQVVRELQGIIPRGEPPDILRLPRPRSSNRSNRWVSTMPSTILYHPKLSDKIREFCRIAREAGFWLIWIDSCCIDKSSSAELSEAINSMYEWYRLADVCFVYLEDVPDGSPESMRQAFRESRWHTRGWTLQELIAPDKVVFLTTTWQFLGTKMGLASTLEDITGIDFDILTGRASLNTISVARRMSWAALRHTTRVEDRAYSLMGIFGVHLSPIYGEGTHAFLRLQEEIIKTIPDPSIFAWGDSCTLLSLRDGMFTASTPSSPGLLAESPSSFAHVGYITFMSSIDFAERVGVRLHDVPQMHCVFTPHGVRTQFLCVNLTAIPQVFEAFFSAKDERPCQDCLAFGMRAGALALLPCEDKAGSLIALPVHAPLNLQDGRSAKVETHSQVCGKHRHRPFRTVRLMKQALAEALPHLISPTPIDVTFLRHYSDPPLPKSRQPGLSLDKTVDLWPGDRCGVAFHMSPQSVQELGALGLIVSPLKCDYQRKSITVITTLRTSTPRSEVSASSEQAYHTYQIQITLIDADRDANQIPSSLARFSVKHRHHRHSQSLAFPSLSPSSLCDIDPWQIVEELPCAEGAGGLVFSFNPSSTTERVIAEANFVVYVGCDWESESSTVRRLRVQLERPLLSSITPDSGTLLVYISMSEVYWFRLLGLPKPRRIDPSLPHLQGHEFGIQTELQHSEAYVAGPDMPPSIAPDGALVSAVFASSAPVSPVASRAVSSEPCEAIVSQCSSSGTPDRIRQRRNTWPRYMSSGRHADVRHRRDLVEHNHGASAHNSHGPLSYASPKYQSDPQYGGVEAESPGSSSCHDWRLQRRRTNDTSMYVELGAVSWGTPSIQSDSIDGASTPFASMDSPAGSAHSVPSANHEPSQSSQQTDDDLDARRTSLIAQMQSSVDYLRNENDSLRFHVADLSSKVASVLTRLNADGANRD